MASISPAPIQEPQGSYKWIDWFIRVEAVLANVQNYDNVLEFTTSGVTEGDILTYNGSNWVNSPVLKLDAGDVTNPILTFHADTATGIYGTDVAGSIDSLHVTINGTEELSVDGTETSVKGNLDVLGTFDSGNALITGTLGATGIVDFDTSLNVDGETRTETLVVDNNTQSFVIQAGSGTPESVVTGNVGDIFVRTDGGASTVLYIKESGTGNTGWIAK